MLYVNAKDQKNERKVLDAINSFPEFEFVDFIQDRSAGAIWDFRGLTLGSPPLREYRVEAKVREINSTDFPTIFISKDKILDMRANPERRHYVAYWFKTEGKVKLYHLDPLELKEKRLKFWHHRAQRQMESDVFEVPSDKFVWETTLK